MPILNYTTSIAVEKTTSEIQGKLARAGAQAVMTEYDDEQVLCALSFRILCNGIMVSFRLPAQIDRIYMLLQRDDKAPRKLKTRDQAARVAWRIIKDWIEAQLAIVEAEQAEMVEVFLPYAQNPATGKTLFEQLSNDQFALLDYKSH
ncbi:hypothetical protein HCU74_08195 [Spongiibacter sp. KMU-166]|uniref:Uncharacterized protein n=1 Tax=Spongiibacter thalassae TaxID=2721624 RepID=A0ABX1GDY6_9GAMM|nr:hypothetical protein [Spongiibacter thalassae]NKI17395.1 hypothetical protein [Spongiibacter thalassae]